MGRSINCSELSGAKLATISASISWRLAVRRGHSVGVILPKELLARLKVEKGDTLYVTDAPAGVTLTPYEPDFAQQLEVGREFMREYRDTFRTLAK